MIKEKKRSTEGTTHKDSTYVADGIIHYCVANMPSSVARTKTKALNNTTLKYGLLIANNGLEALKVESIRRGLNTFEGKTTNKGVAEAF